MDAQSPSPTPGSQRSSGRAGWVVAGSTLLLVACSTLPLLTPESTSSTARPARLSATAGPPAGFPAGREPTPLPSQTSLDGEEETPPVLRPTRQARTARARQTPTPRTGATRTAAAAGGSGRAAGGLPERPLDLHPTANRPYTIANRRFKPMADRRPFRQRGLASWYGEPFHGRKTATGERYDMGEMTAAHPTLPLPSLARVTNVRTGTSIVVRVNDRGPFAGNRIIDLSHAAARQLGFVADGLATVDVELLLPDEGLTADVAD